jgi:hypothetical protein
LLVVEVVVPMIQQLGVLGVDHQEVMGGMLLEEEEWEEHNLVAVLEVLCLVLVILDQHFKVVAAAVAVAEVDILVVVPVVGIKDVVPMVPVVVGLLFSIKLLILQVAEAKMLFLISQQLQVEVM